MKIVYLECNMGAAGDMLMSALYEVCPHSIKEEFLIVMNDLFPDVNVVAETVEKSGIQGTHMRVVVHGDEEESKDYPHSHEPQSHELHNHELHEHGLHSHELHEHGLHNHELHEHGLHSHELHEHELHSHESQEDGLHNHEPHEHHSLMDIHNVIESLTVSEAVKEKACEVYDRIASAEGRVHGREVTGIHFHEVGTKDAIVDIIGCCWLMEQLHPERVVASPIRTGYGQVRCAHGILPVPAPATAYLLQGVPCYAGDLEGEMCTPTGAALLTTYVDTFCSMPVMVTDTIGYGMGHKEFPTLNCVRCYVGTMRNDDTPTSQPAMERNGRIVELACNIDDMTAEEFAYAMDMLREQGAVEVYSVAAQMKKNRSGYVLTCLCRPEQESAVVQAMMKYTTTIGIRRRDWERYELQRTTEFMDSPYGKVRVKVSKGYGVEKKKIEYEDLARIAKEQNCSIASIREKYGLT